MIKSNVSDRVAFYVTSPIKKIIGVGIIKKKFVKEDFFWPYFGSTFIKLAKLSVSFIIIKILSK